MLRANYCQLGFENSRHVQDLLVWVSSNDFLSFDIDFVSKGILSYIMLNIWDSELINYSLNLTY